MTQPDAFYFDDNDDLSDEEILAANKKAEDAAQKAFETEQRTEGLK